MKNPEEMLQKNPGSVLFIRYAKELAEQGKTDEAIEVLTKGIEANPYYAAGYSVLAEIYANKELPDESAAQLEKALSLDPNSPRDLFLLGQHLIETDPEKAEEHLKTAFRYEPENSEISHALDRLSAGEKEEFDYSLSPDTEEALSKLSEEEISDESEDEMIAEEKPEDVVEIEEETFSGEPNFEDLIEENLGEETEETVEDSSDEDIPGFSELLEEEESDEIAAEDSEFVPEPETEPVEIEDEIPELSEEIISEESDETIEPETDEISEVKEESGSIADEPEPDISTEDIVEEMSPDEESDAEEPIVSDVEKEINDEPTGQENPISQEEDIVIIAEDTEPEEGTAREQLKTEETEDEDETYPNNNSDLSGLFGSGEIEEVSENTEENNEQADLSSLIGHVEDDLNRGIAIPSEENAEEESSEYSSLLEEETGEVDESTEQDAEETGFVEIDDDVDYDFSKLSEDIAAEEDDLPVLTDEERAELLALEENEPDTGADIESIDIQDEEESEDNSFDNLYGDLSKDELDVLSVADVEPDQEEKNLEIETNDGIDYSDILYGQDDETIKEDSIDENIEPSVEQDLIDQDEVISVEENTGIETGEIPEESEPDEPEEFEPMILDIGKMDIQDSETEPDIAVPDEVDTITEENETFDFAGEKAQVLDTELNEKTNKTLEDIENASLDDLINDYIGAIQDISEESEPGGTYPISPEILDEDQDDITNSEIETIEDSADEISSDASDDESGEIGESTATMAEIFVSQGLISKALEIYRTLLKKNPDNNDIAEKIKALEQKMS